MSKRAFWLLFSLALLTLFTTPFLGAHIIWPWQIMQPDSPERVIFFSLRLPRVMLAFFTGSSLALGGLVFQGMFQNPLATPYTLGIASGASLGAALFTSHASMFGVMAIFGASEAAMAGALLSMLLVWLLASLRPHDKATLLLAGVIASFFFSSLVMFLQYVGDAADSLQIMRWLMGSFSGANIQAALIVCAICLVASLVIYSRHIELDLMLGGEEFAASRGVNVCALKWLCFLTASMLSGICVSFSGPIGFVGLMLPQICRMRLGPRHKALIPASLYAGGIFLAWCDLFSRSLLSYAELPPGIITSFLGAPFFIWTLMRPSRRNAFRNDA